MKQVKLTKGFLAGNELRISESWISNGHWAIKKENVKNPPTLESARNTGIPAQELTDSVVDGVVSMNTNREPVPYGRTNWVSVNKKLGDFVAYVAEGNRWAWINREYSDRFDQDVLWATGDTGLCLDVLVDDPSNVGLAIMPCREEAIPPGCEE